MVDRREHPVSLVPVTETEIIMPLLPDHRRGPPIAVIFFCFGEDDTCRRHSSRIEQSTPSSRPGPVPSSPRRYVTSVLLIPDMETGVRVLVEDHTTYRWRYEQRKASLIGPLSLCQSDASLTPVRPGPRQCLVEGLPRHRHCIETFPSTLLGLGGLGYEYELAVLTACVHETSMSGHTGVQ